jgi:O-antigen/teichoic acid export membrane protein
MSIVKKLAGDTAIYGIPSIVGRSINFLLIFFFTAYFTPEFLAPHVEFYAYAAFFFVVLPHGMETAFFNFSRGEDSYKDVFATAMTSLLIAVALFIILMLTNKESVGGFVGYPDHISYVVWFTLILAIDVLKSVPYGLLRYLNRAKKFATVKSLGILINVVLNIFFVVYYPVIQGTEPDIEFIFITNLIASGAELLFISTDIFKHLGKASLDLWKRMFKYAWPLILLGFAGVINETFDRLALRKLLPAENVEYEIGVYGAFYKLSMLMTIFIQAFRYAAEPLFFSQANRKDAKESYIKIMDWFIYACGGIFLTVSLFKVEIADLFIRKPEYHNHPDALTIVPILLLANLFLGVFFNLSIWYKLNNKNLIGAVISVLGAILTIILLLIYVPVYGFLAAAITTLLAYLLMTVLSYLLGQRHYPVEYHSKLNIGMIGLMIGLYVLGVSIEVHYYFEKVVHLALLAIYGILGYRMLLSLKNS